MAYAFVQKGFGGVFSGNVVTWSTGATGAGNLLVIAYVKGNNANEHVNSVAGNVNTSQPGWQTAVGVLGNDNSKIINASAFASFDATTLLYLPGSANAGGDTTTTMTIGGDQGGNVFIGAMEFSGIASTSPFVNFATNAQTAPGTGTDAVTSTTVTISTVPALLAGFAFFDSQSGVGTITGTGFAGRGLSSASNAYIWGEDRRITSASSVAATFTQVTNSNTLAIGMAFAEPGGGGNTASIAWVT
jgi:hypothetical protein